MIPDIHRDESNPYALDTIICNNIIIPALTKKNSDFIEAVVRLDSSYTKDLDARKGPAKGFNPLDESTQKSRYCGSTAYWFDEMKSDSQSYERTLMGAVISIDRANSTHLESSLSGRKEIWKRIKKKCGNKKELLRMLNIPFTADLQSNLISIITEPIGAKGENKDKRYNLSYATKFCAYAAYFLGADQSYSKYDNVVSDALPLYVKEYLGEDCKKGRFKINTSFVNEKKEMEQLDYRVRVYADYSECIGKIIDSLHGEDRCIRRWELDHIIWYGLKGR